MNLSENSNEQNPKEKKPVGLIVGVAGACFGIVGIVLVILFATGVIRTDSVPPAPEATAAAPTETPAATPTPKPTMSPDEVDYKKAKSLLSKNKYEEAAKAFKKLGSYEKSKDLYKKSMYLYGKKLYNGHDYEKSEEVFKSLKNYKKSKIYKSYCQGQIFKKQKPTITGWTFGPGEGEAPVTFNWTGVSGASGYEFVIEDDWNSNNIITSSTSCTVTVGDGAAYVKANVRAYKKIGGKVYYSGWSNTAQLW